MGMLDRGFEAILGESNLEGDISWENMFYISQHWKIVREEINLRLIHHCDRLTRKWKQMVNGK